METVTPANVDRLLTESIAAADAETQLTNSLAILGSDGRVRLAEELAERYVRLQPGDQDISHIVSILQTASGVHSAGSAESRGERHELYDVFHHTLDSTRRGE